MKLTRFALALALSVLTLCSCGARQEYRARSVWVMDTSVTVKINPGTENPGEILEGCFELLEYLDGIFSRTLKASDISRINSAAAGAAVSPDTAAVIERALMISELTGGAFDITVLPYVLMWESCEERGSLPLPEEYAEAGGLVGYRKIALERGSVSKSAPGVMLDLGGIGKGYAADRAVDYLISSGVSYGIVSFGSNVSVFGEKPGGGRFKIGIRDPADPGGLVGYVYMSSGALSVSGDYERYRTILGERYHHILSPESGDPVQNGLHSVAVICRSALDADALSTALFVMGEEAATALYHSGTIEFEAVFISNKGIRVTDGLIDDFELFIE